MIRILFVEDDPRSIVDARERCQGGLETSEIKVCGFEEYSEELREFRPDIVILDILRGSPSEGDAAGKGVYALIWDNRFCPIVVYSAEPDLIDATHPFVAKVRKGDGSEDHVLQAVQDFLPHIEALQRTEDQVRRRLSEAMREVAPLAFGSSDDAAKREEIIVRSGRRRVAAMLDEPQSGEAALASWECYLHPPVLPDILLGDVLKAKDGDKNDPGAFRVVLTPSCDMVRSDNRIPKVREVLAAKCFSMRDALASIGMAGNRNVSRIRDRLLSSGYTQSVIPFPALEGLIPTMAANLHDLELIPIGNIGSELRYLRIASLDSPFRELVAWAYLQNAGRPGLPDRDLDRWAQEVRDELESPNS